MNSVINIRTDEKTKQEITDFANELGLSLSAFATVVLKQAVRERRIVLTAGTEPTSYLQGLIKTAEADRAAGQNIDRVTTPADLDDL